LPSSPEMFLLDYVQGNVHQDPHLTGIEFVNVVGDKISEDAIFEHVVVQTHESPRDLNSIIGHVTKHDSVQLTAERAQNDVLEFLAELHYVSRVCFVLQFDEVTEQLELLLLVLLLDANFVAQLVLIA